jgi:iron complex outermembrane receptor protein
MPAVTRFCVLILALAVPPAADARPQTGRRGEGAVTGRVLDESGGAVVGATVLLRTPSGVDQQTLSGGDGRFSIRAPAPGDLVVIVRAEGFAEARQTIAGDAARQDLELVLSPATIAETVTVTAARVEQRTADVPASVNVLGREAIARSAAVVADDVLRQIPTFSLFRRTSSLAAHPTAQGVSLRGVGPSGVSRTLVLLDGIPFNDPFGGWVYWTRVPLESVDRIEVVDSASSSVYGNYAMGGVVNIVSRPPAPRTLELRSQYGSRSTPKIEFSGSDVWGRARAAVTGSLFDTDGYPIVAAEERGLVDRNASVTFANVNARFQYDLSHRLHLFARAGHFREDRDNGKASTIDGTAEANDTRWTSASGGVRVRAADASELQVTAFLDDERFRSNFLAVPAATPPRSVGRMTLNQTVPSRSVGGVALWSRPVGERHFLTAGTDWRWIDGDSREEVLDPVVGRTPIVQRISGGTQRSLGVFVQDLFTPTPRLVLTFAARVDRWRNYDAHHLESTVAGEPTANHRPSLPDRSDTVASPRAAALYHAADWLSVWGTLGWGFRAPTLNELYRQFRVGTVLTLANNQLGPERLVGGELGIRITPAPALTWRTTWFDNRVKDPVSNVTINVAGATVTQQRQNLGRTRIAGIQTDLDYRLSTFWRLSGGYIYNRARVTEFAANPDLVGNFLPQVPRHRGSVQAAYVNPKHVNIAVGLHAIGRQYDDDQNRRVVPGETEPGLPRYALVELTASRALGRNVELFFGVQNLFDREYFVGTLPTTVGAPRLVTGGIRIRFSGR